MRATLKTVTHYLQEEHWRTYFLKAIVLFALILLIKICMPSLPSIAITLILAIVTTTSAIGFAYFAIIRKTEKQISRFQEGGKFAQYNNGRRGTILLSFALAVVFSISLLANIPQWDTLTWCLIALCIPLYYVISIFVKSYVEREYKPLFQPAGVTQLTFYIIVAISFILLLVLSYFSTTQNYSSYIDALHAAEVSFDNSPSILMADISFFTTIANIAIAYGIPEAIRSASTSLEFIGLTIVNLLVHLSIVIGFMNLLNVCYLRTSELRRVFAPLSIEHTDPNILPIQKRFVIPHFALALLVAISFVGVDYAVTQDKASTGQTPIEALTYTELEILTYIIDGDTLNEQLAQRFISESQQLIASWGSESAQEAAPENG